MKLARQAIDEAGGSDTAAAGGAADTGGDLGVIAAAAGYLAHLMVSAALAGLSTFSCVVLALFDLGQQLIICTRHA